MRTPIFLLGFLAALLAGCADKPDQLRTVKAHDLWACESATTSNQNDLTALQMFKEQVEQRHFVRHQGGLIAANHEQTSARSGLREYSGPFYFYLHPRAVESFEAKRGVTWIATVYLHADKVRSRANGAEWGEWQRVRTRNFVATTPTLDGLGKWKCLIGAEIAWAEVSLAGNQWQVKPIALGVYGADELQRANPVATRAQIAGTESVEALIFPD